MDLTAQFRAISNEIVRQYDRPTADDQYKRQKRSHTPSLVEVFGKQCDSLLHELAQLEDCVNRYRQHVMAVDSLFSLGCSALTSDERTALNKLTMGVVKSCELTLAKLDNIQAKLAAPDTNRHGHFESVVQLLRTLLFKLSERHSSLNAQSYDRIVDLQQCCKLRNLLQTNRGRRRAAPAQTRDESSKKAPPAAASTTVQPVSVDYGVTYEHDELASLELEKQAVRKRLQADNKRDVEQMEQKLSTVSSLQKTFAENVLCQDENILRISHSAAQASDSVSDSNKFIKKAMQRQSSTRTWLMFVMLVLTFTLWFLHLYNP